jgi:hypothetical protein
MVCSYCALLFQQEPDRRRSGGDEMAFWGLSIETDDEGNLVPIEVTRARREAHMRDCYPDLYQALAKPKPERRLGFVACCLAGAAAALGFVGAWLTLFR